MSRLSRTDHDWCRLLEVCQLFGTLLGDDDQVYDLGLMDDQLILGIKGTLSVVELKVLQMRLIQGQEAKAARGELERLLPPGYVRDRSGKVVKDPDVRVQQAVELIFSKYRELGSCRQAYLWFRTEEVDLPVNKSRGGSMQIVWQPPTLSFVSSVIHNACYAGAYVYGRRVTDKILVNGRVVRRGGRVLKAHEARVCLWDHHDAYIDRSTFDENLKRLKEKDMRSRDSEKVAAIRGGQGLLTGVLRCGRCGRRIHVHYWGRQGTGARYICKGDYDAGGRYCLAFGGRTVDRRFEQLLLEVISPIGMEASLLACEQLRSRGHEQRNALEKQIEQLQYEAQRAFEQYDEADPRNRLVAAELERRWNSKLEALERAQVSRTAIDQQRVEVGEAEQAEILSLGRNFDQVWRDKALPIENKKMILRTVLEEAIVDLDEDGEVLRFVVRWKGGAHTRFDMPKPVSGAGRKTSLEDIEVIRKMALHYSDDKTASVLSKLGRRTATGKRWNQSRVGAARRRYKLGTPAALDPDVLHLGSAARYCSVSQTTIKRLVAKGLLAKEQVVPYAPWEIQRSDLESEPVCSILDHLRKTGRLVLQGEHSGLQGDLFRNEQGSDRGRYHA